jgi:hypothetical protein
MGTDNSDVSRVGDYDIAAPDPSALIESLRAFGYVTETAVADLVDNSLTAGARTVRVAFEWDGADSTVSICDDGRGMTEDELIAAMRPGSRSPLEERARDDLGRFGLGLKTASFSQCRRLTVVSKRNKRLAHRCWDLDIVGETGEWRLLHRLSASAEAAAEAALGGVKSGTVAHWENLDRILGSSGAEPDDDDGTHDRFLEIARRTQQHLSVTFHRFMTGRAKVGMYMNDRAIEPWDPFVSHVRGGQRLETERLPFRDETVVVTPHVLPHRSRFTDEEFEAAGLHGRWNDLQGFYVYRNDRMLVGGSYLGLGFQKEEHYKLVRIAIDLPNTLDEDWHIDVRKSMADPPASLRGDLRRIARVARNRAAEVYRHRGRILTRRSDDGIAVAWAQKSRRGKIVYQLNREHPIIRAALDGASPSHRATVRAALKLAEETVPIPLIAISTAERPEEQAAPFEGSETELRTVAALLYRNFRAAGLTRDAALRRLGNTDPFNQYPEVLATLEEPSGKNDPPLGGAS